MSWRVPTRGRYELCEEEDSVRLSNFLTKLDGRIMFQALPRKNHDMAKSVWAGGEEFFRVG